MTTPEFYKNELYVILGGLVDLDDPEYQKFIDPANVTFHGAYTHRPINEWRSLAMSTVDNALMKYIIVRVY